MLRGVAVANNYFCFKSLNPLLHAVFHGMLFTLINFLEL